MGEGHLIKKKIYPKREYITEKGVCRCTHEEGMHGFTINPLDKKTFKTLIPCRNCMCPDYKHRITIKEVTTF